MTCTLGRLCQLITRLARHQSQPNRPRRTVRTPHVSDGLARLLKANPEKGLDHDSSTGSSVRTTISTRRLACRPVYPRTFRTRREAETFEASERVSRAEQTLGEVASGWLNSNPAKRPSTRARDGSALRVHILPSLGDRAIGSLTPSDIQRVVNEWAQRLAPRSVRRLYQTLAAVLNAAVLDDQIARTPCRGIPLPPVHPIDRPVITPEEVAALGEALGPRYEAMVYLNDSESDFFRNGPIVTWRTSSQTEEQAITCMSDAVFKIYLDVKGLVYKV